MRNAIVDPMLLATAFALTGCGGDGGGGIAAIPAPPSTPTPTPTPTPTTSIILAASASQQFAAAGASFPIDDDHTPRLGAGDQLQVRYVASTGSYEIQVPHSQTWGAISLSSTDPGVFPLTYSGGGALLWLRGGNYQYSRLFEWNDGDNVGYEAIGMATPAGGVPVIGSASYSGQILGITTEYQSQQADDYPVDGSILLSFNFGLGSLSGSISPNLHQGYAFGALNFANTVYSTGSTTFSGKFDTTATGVNSFGGLFTGPNAQELIGNFAFPYVSPIDSKTYQASGAFVGKK
jgi:C-lobe and N-lobe beta barrels of Tf-binding protein B